MLRLKRRILGLIIVTFLIAGSGASHAQVMIKLSGNHPTGITSQPTGPIDPDRMLSMAITLKLRDQAALNLLLAEQQDPSSPNYHRWLTPQEFSARFGPDPVQFKAVQDWLVAQGFEIVSSSQQRRSITFKGSAARAERVFQTRITAYAGDSYANLTDPSIPERFAGVIGAITGLDNFAHAVPLSSP